MPKKFIHQKLPQNTILRFVALGACMTYHTQLVVRQTPSSRTSILLLSPKHRRRCSRLSHIALRFCSFHFPFWASTERGRSLFSPVTRGAPKQGAVSAPCLPLNLCMCACAHACLGGGERSSPTVASAPTGNDAVPRAARAPEGESHDPPRAVCIRVFFTPLPRGNAFFRNCGISIALFHPFACVYTTPSSNSHPSSSNPSLGDIIEPSNPRPKLWGCIYMPPF